METSEVKLPEYGAKDTVVVPNVPSGMVDRDVNVTLTFGALGKGRCIRCNYDHGCGMWSGYYSFMRQPGVPGTFALLVCPVCKLHSGKAI